jgi:hypothetical protein
MNRPSTRFALALILAGCGTKGPDDAPNNPAAVKADGVRVAGKEQPILPVKSIEGAMSHTFKGMSFDIPKNWRANAQGDVLLLLPDGANPTGEAEEIYLLACRVDIHVLDGAAADQTIDQSVAQLQQGMSRQGAVEKVLFGDQPGRRYRYTGKAQNGRAAEARVYTFLAPSLCGLVALGYPEALSRREADLQAILGSLSPRRPGAANPAELAGRWNYFANVNATNGGRMTDAWIQLNADGSFASYWEVISDGPFGAATNLESDSGAWTATDASLTLRSRSGKTRTYTLERRNHPRNPQDPMIVLDGRAYVTATTRSPW